MIVIASAFIAVALGQVNFPCMYTGGPNGEYELNLTSVSGYRLEYETSDFFYYFTPCSNKETCQQGNAVYYGNSVQYKPGENQCYHYLSVDHHQQPTYLFGAAAWYFDYDDGEMCSVTQEPRSLNVYMLCDENLSGGAYINDVYEYETCRYGMQIRTPLACVPENRHNSNCQFKYTDSSNNSYYLDLSSENGNYYRGGATNNGYEIFYSPCQNGLHCYQQSGQISMMSILENEVTRTCDKYLAEWQDGRVLPIYHGSDPDQIHWSFHYYLSEKCLNGQAGEETIRWYCNENAVNTTVINSTYDGDCRFEFNLESKLACPGSEMYTQHNGFKFEWFNMKSLYKKARDMKL